MTIQLTPQQSEEFFLNAMCNGGLSYLSGYGLILDFNESDYHQSKLNLLACEAPDHEVCYEDVLMQMLRDGYELRIIDEENDGEYNKSITLKDVHQNVQKSPVWHLINMKFGNDDATTADAIFQTVFFGEIIFG